MSKPTASALLLVAALAAATLSARSAPAQGVTGAPLPAVNVPPLTETPSRAYDAAELDRIMSPIALYPDPLLAQVLSAATFASEIPAAMQWVDARRGRTGEQLAEALAAERVPWDPSVQALVAFPTVLQTMATSMQWTVEIGDAFKAQPSDVMDAVQRLRAQAQSYGYLRSTPQLQVVQSQGIEILPVNPSYVVVPYYDPIVVFAPPRPRFLVSSAIYLGFGVRLGLWYEPWGWRSSGFYWPTHRVIGRYPGWDRSYGRTVFYDNRYAVPRYESQRVQLPSGGYYERGPTHQVQGRDYRQRTNAVNERSAARDGRDNRDNHDGRDTREHRDNRDIRDVAWSGRTAQPRVGQSGDNRQAQSGGNREAPRATPQPQPQRGGEQRGSHGGNQGGSRRRN
jgi:hypothetical protein